MVKSAASDQSSRGGNYILLLIGSVWQGQVTKSASISIKYVSNDLLSISLDSASMLTVRIHTPFNGLLRMNIDFGPPRALQHPRIRMQVLSARVHNFHVFGNRRLGMKSVGAKLCYTHGDSELGARPRPSVTTLLIHLWYSRASARCI